MKRHLFLLLNLLIVLSPSFAQKENSQYLFKEFQEAFIYFKSGMISKAEINYNFLTKSFLFYDPLKDNKLMEIAGQENILVVKVGDRSLFVNSGKISELVQVEPHVLVEYQGYIKEKGKNAGYGGKSETAAIQSYSTVQLDGITHALEQEEAYTVARITKRYQIEKEGKKKFFSNSKTFLKIFPEHKKPLANYIADNKINFNSIDEVVLLVNYAISLE